MIFDSDGDALGAYRSRRTAIAALRSMVIADPDSAEDLILISYDREGHSMGESIRGSDLPPQARVAFSSVTLLEGATQSRAEIAPRARARSPYIALGVVPQPPRRRAPLADPQVGEPVVV
jgi:hypothetical protein